MKTMIIIIAVLLFNLSYCQNHPASIVEAIDLLIKEMPEKIKSDFVKKTEKEATIELHMTVGMWIRNSWINHGDENLSKEFNNLGIYHSDDMSGIILTSAHRKMNRMPIKLEEQVQYYKDYWKPIIEQEEKAEKIAVEHYNNRKVGDTINIYYPVSISDNYKNAVIYEFNDEWVFDPKKDLKLTGVITDKFYLNSETNVFFKIKVLEMNFYDIPVLMRKMEVGEIYDFHLDKLRIE